MSRFVRLANDWLLIWQRQQTVFGPGPSRPAASPHNEARRKRSLKHFIFEPVEDRVLLSAVDLKSPAIAPSAEILRARKAPTLIAHVGGIGVQNGAATLTSDGLPLGRRAILFQVRGRTVGRVSTDDQGIAILTGASLRGVAAGAYPRGVVATFAGDAGHRRSSSRGPLIVSRAATSLGGVSATGVYGGRATLMATLTSGGAPLRDQVVQFMLDGRNVGSAATNAQGVALLGNVALAGKNAGVRANAVTARFVGGLAYQQSLASGTLKVNKAQATIRLSDTTQTYDGLLKSVIVGTGPGGLAHIVSYTDANGSPVASPRNAGDYQVRATISDPTYAGSMTGILHVARAALQATGIAASNKAYDGNTSTTLQTGGAGLIGLAVGDSVVLVTSNATGTFDSKRVGTGKAVAVGGLSLAGPGASNYVLIPPTAQANITAATLTVGGVVANNKAYDGNRSATLNTAGAALVGVAPGDQVALNAINATGRFDTPGIGTNKPVTVSGLALAGADSGNYVLTQPTATADITVAVLTVTGLSAADKAYDGTTSATLDTGGLALVGVAPGDDVALDVAAAAGEFASRDAGAGKLVSVSGLVLTGADAGNYALAPIATTATIAAAPLNVVGITAGDRTYDGTTAAALDTAGAGLLGVIGGDHVALDVTGATGHFATRDAGTARTVTVSGLALAGADAANYALTPTTTTANVAAASLTVSGITADDKAFDGTTAATLNAADATLAGVIPGDDLALDVTSAVGVFDGPDPGQDKTVLITGLAISGDDAGNYSLIQPTTTASIT